MPSSGELSPLPLTFRERALEEEYRARLAPQNRRRHPIVWGVVIAVTLGMAAIDGAVVRTDRLPTLWTIRYSMMLPFLVLIGAFGFASPPLYARWGPLVNAFGCAVGLAFVGVMGMAISPMPMATAQYGVVITAVSALGFHTVGMAGFLW